MLSGVSEYELPQDPRWELPRDRYEVPPSRAGLRAFVAQPDWALLSLLRQAGSGEAAGRRLLRPGGDGRGHGPGQGEAQLGQQGGRQDAERWV